MDMLRSNINYKKIYMFHRSTENTGKTWKERRLR